jgi:hypothetical protein
MIASSTVQENWPLAIDHVGLRAAEGNASPSIRPEGNDPVRFGLAGNFDFHTLRGAPGDQFKEMILYSLHFMRESHEPRVDSASR